MKALLARWARYYRLSGRRGCLMLIDPKPIGARITLRKDAGSKWHCPKNEYLEAAVPDMRVTLKK